MIIKRVLEDLKRIAKNGNKLLLLNDGYHRLEKVEGISFVIKKEETYICFQKKEDEECVSSLSLKDTISVLEGFINDLHFRDNLQVKMERDGLSKNIVGFYLTEKGDVVGVTTDCIDTNKAIRDICRAGLLLKMNDNQLLQALLEEGFTWDDISEYFPKELLTKLKQNFAC